MDHQGWEVVENTNQLEKCWLFLFPSSFVLYRISLLFLSLFFIILSNIPGSDRKGRKGGKGRKEGTGEDGREGRGGDP